LPSGNFDGFRKINASELKAGDLVKYIVGSGEPRYGHVIQNVGDVVYIHTNSTVDYFSGESTTFFVKDFGRVEKSEIKIEKRDELVANMKAELETLRKEKAETDAQLVVFKEKLNKRCELFAKKNKDVPQEVLDIVDDWGFFNLISMSRVIFKGDIDVDHLNKFIADSNIKDMIEKDAPVKYTIKFSMTRKCFVSTVKLFHEIHLKQVYDLFKDYFQINNTMVFPINNESVLQIE
jgi:predicted AlkP superfamily phosphohydrolase/phosphomutase